jgi:hypothetical protein
MTRPIDYRRLAELGKQCTGVASDEDFRAALLAAWEALSLGNLGAFVRKNEPWESALVEEAAKFLIADGKGRPPGAVERWERIVDHASRSRSAAPDGMVQAFAPKGHAGSMRVPLSSIPRARRSYE